MSSVEKAGAPGSKGGDIYGGPEKKPVEPSKEASVAAKALTPEDASKAAPGKRERSVSVSGASEKEVSEAPSAKRSQKEESETVGKSTSAPQAVPAAVAAAAAAAVPPEMPFASFKQSLVQRFRDWKAAFDRCPKGILFKAATAVFDMDKKIKELEDTLQKTRSFSELLPQATKAKETIDEKLGAVNKMLKDEQKREVQRGIEFFKTQLTEIQRRANLERLGR